MTKFTKTIAGFAGIAIALSLIAVVAVSSASAATFTRSLTIGSTGADVVALQSWLISKGYSIPAGATGYFGNQTKAAVAAYQAAKGITPAVGYFGPITRAQVEVDSSGTVTGGTTGGSSTSGTGITTPGVEGTIAVTQSSSGINSTVYEGDSMAPILGLQVEAKSSDVSVQRVKIDLGTSTKIYNKIYSRIYVTDGSTVLASSDLNSSTVVKDSGRYYITLAGFNGLVKKDTKKVFTVKVDVRGSIDSTDRSAGDSTLAWGVRLASSGVRAIDGAGIDQYGGDTSISKSITVSSELAETATLNVSTNTATPVAADVVASLGSSENELDKLAVLAIDVRAEKDDVKLKDIALDIDKAGSGAATASTTVYLYDGSTELDNASYDSTGANGGFVKFTDVDYVVPKGTTKTLWVKVDLRNANGTVSQLSVNASSSGMTAENTKGDSVSISGSATGETQYVRNVGAVFTLVSKTISKSSTSLQSNTSTSTAQATFTLKVKAVGGDILFGNVASTVPMVGSSSPYIVTYYNGAATVLSVASSTAFDVPSSGVSTSGLDNSFLLQENNEVTIPVTFTFEAKNAAGANISTGAYSVALERINWKYNGAQTSSFMSGKTDWRTSTVQLP